MNFIERWLAEREARERYCENMKWAILKEIPEAELRRSECLMPSYNEKHGLWMTDRTGTVGEVPIFLGTREEFVGCPIYCFYLITITRTGGKR